MKNNIFAHTGDVCRFTFKEARQGKAFALVTYVVPLILLIGLFLACFLPALATDDEVVTKKIYIVDETGTNYIGDMFGEAYDKEKYDLKVNTLYGGNADEVCAGISQSETDSFVLDITTTEENGLVKFHVTAIIPEWSQVPKDEYEELMNAAVVCVDSIKVATAGVDYQTIKYMSAYTVSKVQSTNAEEDSDVLSYLIKMFVPMGFGLVIYMMVLLYGQSIGKTVIAEKNSKLMEMMLCSVHPEAMISGKIIAMCGIAVGQILLWIIGGVVGYNLGDWAAHLANPSYVNQVSLILEQMAVGDAFSVGAIIVAVLSTVLGFCLFGFLSGVVASTVGKPEELASVMGIYNLIVVAGFIGAYLIEMKEMNQWILFLCVFPITSPFTLGAEVLIGGISLVQGIIGLVIMVVCCAVEAILAAKIYRDKVFYNGSSKLSGIMESIGMK